MTDPSGSLILGMDLGGTEVKLALVDPSGEVRASRRLGTAAESGPERVVQDVVAAARELLGEAPAPVDGVGAGVAGQVDGRRGVIRSSPNLVGWKDFPLAQALEDALGLPAVVTNDVNATAVAEHAAGAGRGVDDLVVLFVGTGVGGGVISGGRPIEGAGGYAGELGHLTIVADGRPCTCGNRGCLEAYAGGWAIAERAKEAVRQAPEAGRALLEQAGGRERITAATVDRAAASGDPLARHLVKETGRYLGAGLVGVVHVFNPRRIVLGGGVIQGMPDLVAVVSTHLRERAIPAFLEELEIVSAGLGSEAGAVGAALLARRRIEGAGAEVDRGAKG